MPQPADNAAQRRDQRLARTRRVSLAVAGGAAVASLGLGTAFAHDLPGHHAPAAGAQPGAPTGARPQSTQPAAAQPTTTSPPPPGTGGAGPAQTQAPARKPAASSPAPSVAPTHLSQPQQPPATTPAPAPAQTVSGGS
jgi:hypothetical protein